jgi:hypothetical protein
MCLLQLHEAVIIMDFSNFEIVDQSYMYKTESDQKDCLNSCSLILVVQLLSSYFSVDRLMALQMLHDDYQLYFVAAFPILNRLYPQSLVHGWIYF